MAAARVEATYGSCNAALTRLVAKRRSRAGAHAVTLSLAHRLAHTRGVVVLPATLAAGYRTPHDSAHAIAGALGVRYLVVGRVDRSPTAAAPDRITIDARLIDTEDSPPTVGQIVSTPANDLCPAIAVIALDIAGHFARAPHGPSGIRAA